MGELGGVTKLEGRKLGRQADGQVDPTEVQSLQNEMMCNLRW